MNLKYTAWITSLLMACPLVTPSVSVAAGWKFVDNATTWYYGQIQARDNVESSDNHVTSLPENRPNGSSDELFVIGCATSTGGSKDRYSKTINNTFTYTGGEFYGIAVGSAGVRPVKNTLHLYDINSISDNNKISLTNAKVEGYVLCGLAAGRETATANGNTIELNGGTYGRSQNSYFVNNLIGCALLDIDDFNNPKVTNNSIILKGGTYNASYISTGAIQTSSSKKLDEVTVINNLVELHVGTDGKSPKFLDSTLIAASFFSTEDKLKVNSYTIEGNSLKFYDVKGMTAGNIQNFQNLIFDYAEMHDGDVILTLNGIGKEKTTSIANADVAVSVVNLYGNNGGEFKIGDKVVLLKNDNGLVTDGITTKATITAKTGISLTYEVEIQANDTDLYLTRTGTKAADVQPGTKAIAEGAAAGLALASESSNAAIDALRDFSMASGAIAPFVHVQASSMRHETGSSINLSTVSLLAGLGTGIDTGAGKLSAGAFFEYGKGSYTTHNSFSDYNDVDGDGNSWYMGGGILAKMEFLQTGPGHFYLEGSAHMGTLHNEYDSNDLYDASGNVAKFDMDSPYYSLHGGLGYVWNMAEGHDLDIYGKYIWTRVQGTDDTLTTKDKFEYDDMDSNRVRFGVRYSYNGSERFKPYVGVAYEHEFSGSCESTAYGHNVAAPSFEGSSGMGELGLMMKPTEDLPLSINLGVQGYVGQKQGISGSCNVMYEF